MFFFNAKLISSSVTDVELESIAEKQEKKSLLLMILLALLEVFIQPSSNYITFF